MPFEGNVFSAYSQICVKRPYKTRFISGFSDRWLLIAVLQLSSLPSCSDKQAPVLKAKICLVLYGRLIQV